MIPTPSNYYDMLSNFCEGPLNTHPTYVNNQQSTLINALETNYPLIKHLLGDDVFYVLATTYAQTTPSENWDLNTYGQAFSKLLRLQNLSIKADEHDWSLLSDLADFEYQIIAVYYDQPKCHAPLFIPASSTTLPALKHFHPYLRYDDATLESTYVDLSLRQHDKRFTIQISASEAKPQ